jgi:hypothetical protein
MSILSDKEIRNIMCQNIEGDCDFCSYICCSEEKFRQYKQVAYLQAKHTAKEIFDAINHTTCWDCDYKFKCSTFRFSTTCRWYRELKARFGL